MTDRFVGKIKDGALQSAPVFTAKGKSWLAIIYPDPGSKYKCGRIFQNHSRKGLYKLECVEVGDILEFGADLIFMKDEAWVKEKQRWIGKILSLSSEEIVLERIAFDGSYQHFWTSNGV